MLRGRKVWDDLQARQKDLVRRMVLFCTLRSGSTSGRTQPLPCTAERNALGSSWELRKERYFFSGEIDAQSSTSADLKQGAGPDVCELQGGCTTEAAACFLS